MLALEKLVAELRIGRLALVQGSLTVVPRVNSAAAERGLHFVDENLNRVVRRHAVPVTHERRLANELLPLIEAADAVLDLHGTQAPTRPFVFLDDERPAVRAWAESLGADFLLTGWPALYAGAESVTTTEYAQSLGTPALTVEAGQNDEPAAAEYGLRAARRSLAHFGLIAPDAPALKPRALRLTGVVRREKGGDFVRPWKNFDPVKKGDLLARRAGGAGLVARENGFVVMPFDGAGEGEEWYYLAAETA